MSDSDYEQKLECLSSVELERMRTLQAKLYDTTKGIDDLARISKYGWGGFAAIVGFIAISGNNEAEQASIVVMTGGLSAGSHFLRKWNDQRLLRHEFDLRTTERVLDRRLGINPELNQ